MKAYEKSMALDYKKGAGFAIAAQRRKAGGKEDNGHKA